MAPPPPPPRHEVQSAAEFFSEHQNIAGFDNPGKSLYTTIRELVENSLDAAEAIKVAPQVSVSISEVTQEALDLTRGLEPSSSSKRMFYRVSCKDNGCGMEPAQIPEMMGRVLSGSKFGVRQTRGKFGLGAKMALIWAKKSSGLPIQIRSATGGRGHRIVLDMDVHKNAPKVLESETEDERWRGTEVTVTVGGAWSAYKARICTYFQQLAIITPYADLEFAFGDKLTLKFEKRSEKIPIEPKRTGYHPSALNELLLSRLLERTTKTSLHDFLLKGGEIAGLSSAVVEDVAREFPRLPSTPNAVARLSRFLRDAKCKPPDASVLSPVGEYNLRLGITKEIKPSYVATHTARPSSHSGHPFIVEAAVSVGGDEGIYRFANRIPLLFEAGADVVTRVAKTKIKWAAYKIDPKVDKVGVFVSLVSTKVPFKGTSKEYIGEDATEIHDAVKSCLQHCCQQLKAKLVRRDADKKVEDRKKLLLKYTPDAARSLWKVLEPLKASADPKRSTLKRRLPEHISEAFLLEHLKAAVDEIPRDEDDRGEEHLLPFVFDRPDLSTPFFFHHPLFSLKLPSPPNDSVSSPVLKKPKLGILEYCPVDDDNEGPAGDHDPFFYSNLDDDDDFIDDNMTPLGGGDDDHKNDEDEEVPRCPKNDDLQEEEEPEEAAQGNGEEDSNEEEEEEEEEDDDEDDEDFEPPE
ncbi:hypothetical protein CTAYLR_000707 [Chrysophaeum taylorii]|uniref:DNA topoisomerase VI subunit B transducer domain-containing protein n=1 Tax=Chrysophaeum taylorii TaxID=2483200 RepID=A0AAD7U8J9_9STRA|nr:hypothetical protein CTAYLR_000707 [Chrysophaeum taylorii]